MPVPAQNLRTATQSETQPDVISFALAPAHNAALSLLLLNQAEELSGMDEWVEQAYKSLSAEQLHTHRLVTEGFYSLTTPQRDYASYPAFIDDLASREPEALRSQMLKRVAKACNLESLDEAAVLESADAYMDWLNKCYPDGEMHEEIEREAYDYLRQPEQMQALLVDHMRSMWELVLADEWRRNQPLLEEAVKANQQMEFDASDRAAALQQITGRDLDSKFVDKLVEAQRLVFVPSPHVGPYVGSIHSDEVTWIIFGARLPEGARVDASALSRAQILVRLDALADDTRLQILRLVAERGEMRSQEVMEALDLSQSASSRHLKQLSATGYLIERRCQGAKCYAFNPTRVENTLEALGSFLLE